MAQSTKQQEVELEKLAARAHFARIQLTKSHAELKEKLDIPSRLKQSVKSSVKMEPKKWLGGSVAIGLLGSFLLRPKKSRSRFERRARKAKKQRNFLLVVLGFAVTALKPIVRIYASKLLKDYFKNQFTKGSALSPRREALPRG